MEYAIRDDSMPLPGGRVLHWCEFGAPSGDPVLYCHGLPGSRYEAALVAAPAADHDLRVIAPDRPGYGGTSPRPGRALGDEVDDVRALMDHMGLSYFDTIGFSGGGPHALACAARMPGRVRRLGLVSSMAPFDRAGKEGMTDGLRALWDLAESDFSAFEQALADAVEDAGGAYGLMVGAAPEADRATLQAGAVAAHYRADMEAAMAQGLAGLFEDAWAVTGPWAFDVEAADCTAWLWHGDRDGNAPVGMGRWLRRHLPAGVLTEWTGGAHFEAFRRWPEVLAPHAGP